MNAFNILQIPFYFARECFQHFAKRGSIRWHTRWLHTGSGMALNSLGQRDWCSHTACPSAIRDRHADGP